jgi:dUTP pyrophosphatase
MQETIPVHVRRVDTALPLPIYQTPGAVGFDLIVREDTSINPWEIALVPCNLIVQTPPGYMLLVAARSSTPRRKGLLVPHGVGIIDQDYCGPDDEIRVQVLNFTSQPVVVKRGERIAQAILVRIARAELVESDTLPHQSRGGFGSTG